MDINYISVIIPVYNGEKTLRKCVQSIENQTYKNIKIIISDDGSTDGSVAEAEKLAREYDNITLVKNKHGGVSSARNAGLEYADGEYISFIDCDDEIKADMLGELLHQLRQNEAELAVAGIERVESDGTTFFAPYSDKRVVCVENAAKLYQKPMYFNSCSNKLYIADIMRKNGIIFDEGVHIGEDFLFNTKYIRYISKVAVISEPMYIYIMSGATSMLFTDTSRFDIIARMYDSIIPFADNDAELMECIKAKIYDEYLLAVRLYCMSGVKFCEKLKTIRRVFGSRQYRTVENARCVGGIYGAVLAAKSAFLVNLYFLLSGIRHKK